MNQTEPILESVLGALRSLPLGVHAVPIIGLIAGIVLWLWGGKFLRPITVILSLAIGAGLGALLAPAAGLTDVGGLPAPYVGLGVGALIGLCAGLVLFRFSMGMAAAAALATATFLGATVYLSSTNQLPPAPRADERSAQASSLKDQLRESLGDLRITARKRDDAPTKAGEPVTPTAGAAKTAEEVERSARAASLATNTRAFVNDLSADLAERWDAMTPRARLILFGGTLAGWMLGLAIGLASPKRTSAIVTAFLGAALWLACGLYLLRAGGVSLPDALADRPLWWAIGWLAVALAGVGVQSITSRAKPPAPAPAAA